MEYISSILWILSWPVVIIASYQLIKFFLKVFDNKIEKP